MLKDLPGKSFWSIGGVGHLQLDMNSISIAIGGGVRVGIEDNIWYDRHRTRPARNIDLLRRVHAIAYAQERSIMSSKEMRKILGLETQNFKYGMKSR